MVASAAALQLGSPPIPRTRLIGREAERAHARILHSMNGDAFEEMVPLIPKDRLIVADSGIKTAEDVARLKALGVHAMLVGESFLRQADVEKAAKTLAEAGR